MDIEGRAYGSRKYFINIALQQEPHGWPSVFQEVVLNLAWVAPMWQKAAKCCHEGKARKGADWTMVSLKGQRPMIL